MKEIAAYLLLKLGGNASPDAAAIGAVLSAVGVTADDEAVTKLLADVAGKVGEQLRGGCTLLVSSYLGCLHWVLAVFERAMRVAVGGTIAVTMLIPFAVTSEGLPCQGLSRCSNSTSLDV
jgi:hypothetical protein